MASQRAATAAAVAASTAPPVPARWYAVARTASQSMRLGWVSRRGRSNALAEITAPALNAPAASVRRSVGVGSRGINR